MSKILIVFGISRYAIRGLHKSFRDRLNIVNQATKFGLVQNNDYETYLKGIREFDEKKGILDLSLSFTNNPVKQIRFLSTALREQDVQVLFLLTDPFRLGFENYLDDINERPLVFLFHPHNIYTPTIANSYFQEQHKTLMTLAKSFGKEKIIGIQPGEKIPEDITSALKLDDNVNFPNLGNYVFPSLNYNPYSYSDIVSHSRVYELQPRSLLIRTRRHEFFSEDFDQKIGNQLLANYVSWQSSLDISGLGLLAKTLAQEFKFCGKTLGIKLKPISDSLHSSKIKKFSRRTIERLEPICHYGDNDEDYKINTNWQMGSKLSLVSALSDIERTQSASIGERLVSLRYLLHNFGPTPEFVIRYLRLLVQAGNIEEARSSLKKVSVMGQFVSLAKVAEDLNQLYPTNRNEGILMLKQELSNYIDNNIDKEERQGSV